MFITKFRRLGQAGDTIVEVMIAMSVMSMILGGAYVMTNKSLQGTRDAQERVNATKLAETQLELLKSLATSNPKLFSTDNPITLAPFCMTPAGIPIADTNVACKVDAGGTATTAEPLYRLSVVRNVNDFTVSCAWTNTAGNNQENLKLKYRVYLNHE